MFFAAQSWNGLYLFCRQFLNSQTKLKRITSFETLDDNGPLFFSCLDVKAYCFAYNHLILLQNDGKPRKQEQTKRNKKILTEPYVRKNITDT